MTQEDAIRFLEGATRNWRRLNPLSKDDIEDVRGALEFFARHRQSSTEEVERLREALIECGRAAGCILADDVSTDFLMHVPGEVRAKVTALTGVKPHDD